MDYPDFCGNYRSRSCFCSCIRLNLWKQPSHPFAHEERDKSTWTVWVNICRSAFKRTGNAERAEDTKRPMAATKVGVHASACLRKRQSVNFIVKAELQRDAILRSSNSTSDAMIWIVCAAENESLFAASDPIPHATCSTGLCLGANQG